MKMDMKTRFTGRSWLVLGTVLTALVATSSAQAGSGRFLATGGIQSLDGAAGGGINPWAVIAGYGTSNQWGATASYTNVTLPDFNVNQLGASVGINNRFELSYAYQQGNLSGALDGQNIGQHILGAKVRLLGDAIYDQDTPLPQLALGVEYKQNLSGSDMLTDGGALGGAVDDSGTDVYLSATKVMIGGFFGYNWLVNANLRYTKANETGLLGFGGPGEDDYELRPEFSTAVLVRPDVAIGYEYKQMGDNLSGAGLKESDWHDVFIAYFPNKSVSFAVAYAHLGDVGGEAIDYTDENGIYLNATVSF